MAENVEIKQICIVFEENMDGALYQMPISTATLGGIDADLHNKNIYISFRTPYHQFDSVIVYINFDDKKNAIYRESGYYYMISHPPKYHEETLKYYKYILIPFKGDILDNTEYENFMSNLKHLPDKELIDFLLL